VKLFVESSAIFGERSGIGQYTKRLVEAYHASYPKQHIKLFGFKFISRPFTPPLTKDTTLGYRLIRWIPGRAYTGSFKKGIKVPIDVLLGAGPKDVFLYPNFVKWPHLLSKRSITIIHDVSFITHGQYSSPPNRAFMLKYVPLSIKNSSHIVTISECSKRAIIEHYGVDAKNISIVYPFVDTNEFKRVDAIVQKRVAKKYSLPEKYLLFIGNIEPRKNLKNVLLAYEALPNKIKADYALVVAGGKGWLNDEIHLTIDRLVSSGHTIIRTGYVDDNDIAGLISGASIFLFIPHYEGFGIPPLEAMACGVPVISANNSSLPEAVGKAGLYVDADVPSQTTAAITTILSNKKLQERLVKAGHKQVAKFTPANSAAQLHSVIGRFI
jgi:glycosyltransferase involved in cell wall biosynthesis